ncbi:hypothetical protein ATANTOWER_030674 [Ataeniobius toweri]|uniref:Uncharacterized protein n=1 Tax=Ataeniobius toweri TaxID=208326 RepID=A0ABU7B9B8_9TELE|nr:hypothetical protein [Ataeniobius toweri]
MLFDSEFSIRSQIECQREISLWPSLMNWQKHSLLIMQRTENSDNARSSSDSCEFRDSRNNAYVNAKVISSQPRNGPEESETLYYSQQEMATVDAVCALEGLKDR